MEGFYLILGQNYSLSEVGKRLGAVVPCAVHYHPLHRLSPGEPSEISAEGDTGLILIHIPLYIEEESKKQISDYFYGELVRVYSLTYRPYEFFKMMGPLFLNDPFVWVLGDDGITPGVEFLTRL